MPALVDTTIRLLSQEPLSGRVPTGARSASSAGNPLEQSFWLVLFC